MKTELKECPKCKASVEYKGVGHTLVYYGPFEPGHDHDDNCKHHMWVCTNGHEIQERQQNICPAPGCDWKGKTDCFCSKLGITVYDPKEKS